jgi:uncharacterized protein (TIGR01777 family)
MEKQIILLAGGTGLIGKQMQAFLQKQGHEVRVLSRKPSDLSKNIFHWEPTKEEIDVTALNGVTTIINLSGAGIADKRWTTERKREMIDSRVQPTHFLASLAPQMSELKQYISASGINCYGYDNHAKVYQENDPFGKDFLSQVVEKWEQAADTLSPYCVVSKIRISVVLTAEGGALETIAKPIKMGLTSALGSGKQWMPWIHIDDLIKIFNFVMENRLEGSFNANAKNVNNLVFTETLAKQLHKKRWLPNVPAFVLKTILGEMATVVLEGVNASNEKIKKAGFVFQYEHLSDALKEVYG